MFQVVWEVDGRQQVFTVLKDALSIGRANDNDIVLNDFSVSRRHAYLKKENGAWVIHDNQSTNGVRVNDKAVPSSPRTPMSCSRRIRWPRAEDGSPAAR